jgi:hypothetical protein
MSGWALWSVYKHRHEEQFTMFKRTPPVKPEANYSLAKLYQLTYLDYLVKGENNFIFVCSYLLHRVS